MAHLIPMTDDFDLSRDEETDLIARVNAGDQAACTRLVALFGPQMMRVARRFMRCDASCDDALQDALFSAFRAISRFEAGSRLSTWLHRIMVNSCLMKLRVDSSRRETSTEDFHRDLRGGNTQVRWSAATSDPSAIAEARERRAAVRRAMDHLIEADRAVLLLRDIVGLDTATTAVRLNTSEHNVKRRLRRARKVLHARMEPLMAVDLAA